MPTSLNQWNRVIGCCLVFIFACDSERPTDAGADAIVADSSADATNDVSEDVTPDAPNDLGVDAPTDVSVDADVSDNPVPISNGTNFFDEGPAVISVSTGTLSESNCELDYSLFVPAGGESAPLVVLGHGFSKRANTVEGFARHIASFGVRVVTPSYCFSSFLNVDHAANGRSAAALSAELAMGAPVIHIGHSAGGLSAVLGAANDSAAVGALGLDLVDADDQALNAAGTLSLPMLGLVGDPAMCNSNNNGDAVFNAASAGQIIALPGALHCDFEDPTDGICRTLCGTPTAEILVVNKALSAAFVSATFGLDATASRWFETDGEVFLQLAAEGLVVAR